jgi:Leucine-rich repeat (LRR) protein
MSGHGKHHGSKNKSKKTSKKQTFFLPNLFDTVLHSVHGAGAEAPGKTFQGVLPFLNTKSLAHLEEASKGMRNHVRSTFLGQPVALPPGASLAKFLTTFPKVTNLDVSAHPTITDEAFEEAGPLLKHVTTLDISNCRRVTPDIFAYMPHIKQLAIKYMNDSHRFHAINTPFAHLESLTHLDATSTFLQDEAFASLTHLTTLKLYGCSTTTDAALTHLTNLTSLNIKSCLHITGSGFQHLPNLTTLVMSWATGVTDDSFRPLTHLTELDAMGCTQLSDEAFKPLKHLEKLNISNCAQPMLTDDAFAPLTQLKELNIMGCRQLTPAMFTKNKLPHLLFVGGCYALGSEMYEAMDKLTAANFLRLRGKKHRTRRNRK